ncbi:Helix-turn-helix domain protein [Marinomonas spartinae]|uniref:helix-turn-helix domain-containing protein n=1 Tax=Marinomonas spartinae TaxID=1792290 RepID=UPI000808B60B|nr:helix-turn-helix transcriptional regulator [Marinomonas spartinae]SBS27189.1 Helix-turn-helix domain protein [Marinomonas spartinae]
MATREQIGKSIQEKRKSLHLTQEVVSKKACVHKTTISEIENGRFTGSFDIFERVIDVIGLQFVVAEKDHKLPKWNEIDALFSEDQ